MIDPLFGTIFKKIQEDAHVSIERHVEQPTTNFA